MAKEKEGGGCRGYPLSLGRWDGGAPVLWRVLSEVRMGSSAKVVKGICLGFRMKGVVDCNLSLVEVGIRCWLRMKLLSRGLSR